MNGIEKILEEKLGRNGRMISGSKSGYCRKYPNRKPIFNANIIVDGKKVWYGDLDLVVDNDILQEISNITISDIYILREMDGRFEYETSPLVDNAVKIYSPK